MVIVDTIARLIPGSLGNPESLVDESFSQNFESEYPQYTRPEKFITERGEVWAVPEVLLSGNHEEVKKWKQNNSEVV